MERKNRKIISKVFIASFVFLFCLGYAAFPMKADASDDLVVNAGFYGGPYYEISSFSYNQMASMSTPEVQIYTGVDAGNFLRVCYAWGMPFRTLVTESNIDLASVKFFHMKTDDSYLETYSTFSADTLLGTRYAFPNFIRLIEDPYASAATIDYSKVTEEITSGSRSVPAILALGNTEFSRANAMEAARNGYASYSPEELPNGDGYRLIFGQLGLANEAEAHNVRTSDKWVKEVNIQLSGSPTISVEKTLISGEEDKIGSRYSLKLYVSLPSSYSYIPPSALASLRDQVLGGTVLGDYDTSVASVVKQSNGEYEVEIVGEGDVELTFSYSRAEYGGGTTSAVPGVVSLKGIQGENAPEGPQEPEEPEEPQEPEEPKEPEEGEKPDIPDIPIIPGGPGGTSGGGHIKREIASKIKKTGGATGKITSNIVIAKNETDKKVKSAQKADANKKEKTTGTADKDVSKGAKWSEVSLPGAVLTQAPGDEEDEGRFGLVGMGVAVLFCCGFTGSVVSFYRGV